MGIPSNTPASTSPALIGRDHPAGTVRAEIERAAASHGGLVLVTGEAGVGKTTLVTAAVDEARRSGALVLSGACWESDSVPGYWPWIQVIRALLRSAAPAERAQVEEAADGGLAVLLGEASDSDGKERFRLYDAVTTALVTAAQTRPLVVVLDDLHWADTASVELLDFAARHTWFERLLLVGTYRDDEVELADHALQPHIAALVARATTVTLTGLNEDDTGALIARTVGREPEADLVAEVHRRTGGNPFFVEQTARLWHGGSAITAVAPGVRAAVRRRLSFLPESVVDLLTSAAVLGREFHRQVLAATAAAPVPHVDRLLEAATAARLVAAHGAGRFGFAHDLVRETLYDALDEADKRERHAAVVHALDRSPALSEHMLPAELAQHAYLAGGELDSARAVDLLFAAARDAGTRMAEQEAIRHYRRAWERAGTLGPRRRARIAFELGDSLFHAGDKDGAWEAFDSAVETARASGDPKVLARAALSLRFHGSHDPPASREGLAQELISQAHRELFDGSDTGSAEPSAERKVSDLIMDSLRTAREDQDDEALSFALTALHHSQWGPGSGATRAELTKEMYEVARRTGDADLEHISASLRWVALLEQGDPGYLDQFRSYVDAAERAGRPRFSLYTSIDRGIIAAFHGDFAEAEARLAEAEERLSDDTYVGFMGFTLHHEKWGLLLLQGKFAELDGLHRELRRRCHPEPQLLEAITAVQCGDLEPGLRLRREHAGTEAPYSWEFSPLWLRLQAQIAAATRDPELCESARTALAPYTDEWLVSLYAFEISGPVRFWLGMVDAAGERWGEAVEHFTAARASAEEMRARPWSIEIRAHLAPALLARGAAGDAATAAALLEEVEREAAEIGMRHVQERVRRLAAQAPDTAGAVEAAGVGPEAGDSANEFRFDGEVWSLRFGGAAVHMPDAKGLRDLHLLLSSPGADVAAVRLLDPEGGETAAAAARMGGDEVLDERAKAEYRRRLSQLDEEIDRAAGQGDDARAAEYDRERAALLEELRAAAGLAGRTRRLGDAAERARKTVTARIRDTLGKLEQRHPELAAHLRECVSTGAQCSYRPEREVRWRL